jgi:hypothetical protein
MGVSQRAIDGRSRSREGRVGAAYRTSTMDEFRTGINRNPQAVQITTVTLTDQGDDDDVIITIEGVNVSINTGTGLTLAQIGAALVVAINGNPTAYGVCSASFDTATLTLTGHWPGRTFTVSIASDPDSVLSAVTTSQSAAEAEAIPFGRCLITQGFDSSEDCEIVALAKSSLLTAQVITLAFGTFVDAQVNTITVYEVRGGEREEIASVSEVAATSRDVTVDALVALLATALSGTKVSAAADAGTATAIVFTATAAGYQFDVGYHAGHEGLTLQSLTRTYTTGPDETTSIHLAMRGVSVHGEECESPTIGSGDGEWRANAGVVYAKKAQRWVESAEAIGNDAPCYVELGVAADNGQLFAATSATRVKLAHRALHFIRDGRVTNDGIAAVDINL